MAQKYAYGGIKENLYIIAAAIYVGGIFLIFYFYETYPGDAYTLIPNVTYLSIFGAFILFGQLLVAAWKTPNEPQGS